MELRSYNASLQETNKGYRVAIGGSKNQVIVADFFPRELEGHLLLVAQVMFPIEIRTLCLDSNGGRIESVEGIAHLEDDSEKIRKRIYEIARAYCQAEKARGTFKEVFNETSELFP